MSCLNLMLSSLEHDKSFITSRPGWFEVNLSEIPKRGFSRDKAQVSLKLQFRHAQIQKVLSDRTQCNSDNAFFKGGVDPNATKSGPSLARQPNAIWIQFLWYILCFLSALFEYLENLLDQHWFFTHYVFRAETETKAKLEKVAEIKKINANMMSIKSEISKYEDTLKEYQMYRSFLENLTPPVSS